MRFVDNFFFFKQKTAYEMRISDWSSDVCSSDLPVEVQEQLYPVLFERYAIHEGSGGKGQFRGGMGIHYRIRLRAGSAKASMVMDHGKFGPPGAAGGEEGGRTRVTIYRNGEVYVPSHVSKDQGIAMQAGDVIEVFKPGGGSRKGE